MKVELSPNQIHQTNHALDIARQTLETDIKRLEEDNANGHAISLARIFRQYVEDFKKLRNHLEQTQWEID